MSSGVSSARPAAWPCRCDTCGWRTCRGSVVTPTGDRGDVGECWRCGGRLLLSPRARARFKGGDVPTVAKRPRGAYKRRERWPYRPALVLSALVPAPAEVRSTWATWPELVAAELERLERELGRR